MDDIEDDLNFLKSQNSNLRKKKVSKLKHKEESFTSNRFIGLHLLEFFIFKILVLALPFYTMRQNCNESHLGFGFLFLFIYAAGVLFMDISILNQFVKRRLLTLELKTFYSISKEQGCQRWCQVVGIYFYAFATLVLNQFALFDDWTDFSFIIMIMDKPEFRSYFISASVFLGIKYLSQIFSALQLLFLICSCKSEEHETQHEKQARA